MRTGSINVWYGAQFTHTFVLNKAMPSSAENQHPYDRRGWCIFEMYLSSLVKDDYCFLKLSEMGGTETNWQDIRDKCKVSRPAPMSPDAFEAMLNAGVQKEAESLGSGIKFTSGKDLTEVVIPQYKKGFLRLMGAADTLMYTSLGWGDEEAKDLAAALAVKDENGRGALPSLTKLYLSENQIGDEGMKAFAAAIGSGALPALKMVVVDSRNEKHPQLMAACQPQGIKIV